MPHNSIEPEVLELTQVEEESVSRAVDDKAESEVDLGENKNNKNGPNQGKSPR